LVVWLDKLPFFVHQNVLFTAEPQSAQRLFILCLPLIPQFSGTGIPANTKDNPP
jgi:hypothetical protein